MGTMTAVNTPASAQETLELRPPQCNTCGRKDGILLCGRCRIVYYCGPDHKEADSSAHRPTCGAVKRWKVAFEQAEDSLRGYPGDGRASPPNRFQRSLGHFASQSSTQGYVLNRWRYIEAVLDCFGGVGGHREAVEMALEHQLDLLLLCRADEWYTRMRDRIPSLFIRLGRDIQALAFIEWFETTARDPGYDWENLDLPFVDATKTSLFEPVAWKAEDPRLSHLLAQMLIDIRNLVILQSYRSTLALLAGRLPQELVDKVLDEVLVHGRGRDQLHGMSLDMIETTIKVIVSDIGALYEAIHQSNPYVWEVMLENPRAAVGDIPIIPLAENLYLANRRVRGNTVGMMKEASAIIKPYCAAWEETPLAFDALRAVASTYPESTKGPSAIKFLKLMM